MKLTIGKRVKELRVKNKMTQEQLAEAVDACVGYISKIENNRVNNISLSLTDETQTILLYIILPAPRKIKSKNTCIIRHFVLKYLSICYPSQLR